MRLGLMLWVSLLVVTSTTGCARRYVITTIGGGKIITASKPKAVESKYVYRDASGQAVEISKLRVRMIEPYSKKAAGRQTSIPELQ